LEKNIGESVIVNKDTLTIVHYKYQTGEYLMEDGQYINEKIILFKLNKK
jgi:protein involved in sex pheromone biosynthesis